MNNKYASHFGKKTPQPVKRARIEERFRQEALMEAHELVRQENLRTTFKWSSGAVSFVDHYTPNGVRVFNYVEQIMARKMEAYKIGIACKNQKSKQEQKKETKRL